MAEELEHSIKCRSNQSCTIDKISKTLKYLRKKKNIGKNSLFRGNSFKEKQPYRFDNKDNPKEKIADGTKKKKNFQNCGLTDHFDNNYPKEKNRIHAIGKVPEEETQEEDSESDSIGQAIREIFDDDQDTTEEFLVEYQE
ncbi:hypothetical protein O181_031954 [Austropuccinia psidii MF-1]|uniref:Uncharacterized protein n=1 Tax=Austropuccinia psidii MF-1 TaxID=1389203 RepID=A0A9Q3CVW2_9BASI|nr:hypothetical protein [Austropuccinia psidii MF-1]